MDSQEFSFEEKYRYMSFLRGTLSRYELVGYITMPYIRTSIGLRSILRYSLLKVLCSDLLSISKETANYYESLGITNDDLKEHEFGIDDFAYYLTDNLDDESKYMISALGNSNNYQPGVMYFDRWRGFIEGKKGVKDENTI